MEWVSAGLALCSLGVLVFFIAFSYGATNPASVMVIRLAAALSFIMGIWTYVIGFKTSIILIKIYSLILTGVALFFYLGAV